MDSVSVWYIVESRKLALSQEQDHMPMVLLLYATACPPNTDSPVVPGEHFEIIKVLLITS